MDFFSSYLPSMYFFSTKSQFCDNLILLLLPLLLLSVGFAPCKAWAALRIQEHSRLEATPHPMVLLPFSFPFHSFFSFALLFLGEDRI